MIDLHGWARDLEALEGFEYAGKVVRLIGDQLAEVGRIALDAASKRSVANDG